MSEIVNALEDLARLLEGKKKPGLKRTLYVAAFGKFTTRGRPASPEAIEPGDKLYIARTQQPGAGTISKSASGMLYGIARGSLAAGKLGQISATLYEKQWVTDSNPCEICDENAIAGWIPADELFPSGDEEPDAHPNCKCELDVRPAGAD